MVPHAIRAHGATRQKHPRRKNILAGTREADLSRLFVVQQSSRSSSRADQVVTQQCRPQLLANHLRRLATHMTQIQRVLDTSDVKFRVPAKTVQLGDVFFRVLLGIR